MIHVDHSGWLIHIAGSTQLGRRLDLYWFGVPTYPTPLGKRTVRPKRILPLIAILSLFALTNATNYPSTMLHHEKKTPSCHDKPLSSHDQALSRSCNVSLRHLGFKQHLKGVTPRPIIPFQEHTMHQVRRYLELLQGGSALSLSMDDLTAAAETADFPVAEPTPRERYCRYLRIKNYGL